MYTHHNADASILFTDFSVLDCPRPSRASGSVSTIAPRRVSILASTFVYNPAYISASSNAHQALSPTKHFAPQTETVIFILEPACPRRPTPKTRSRRLRRWRPSYFSVAGIQYPLLGMIHPAASCLGPIYALYWGCILKGASITSIWLIARCNQQFGPPCGAISAGG